MGFPNSVDSFTTKVDTITTELAADVNNLQSATVSIEQILFGSAAATSQGNVMPVFNVMSGRYGAKGDSTTDDSTAIQNAINDAITANGGIIFFPAGRYKIVTGLVATNAPGLTFKGVGRHWWYSQQGSSLGGSVLQGATNGMTILKTQWTAGSSLHQGPTFENLAFEDPSVNLNTVIATSVSYSAPNTTVTVPSTTGIVDGQTVYLSKFTSGGLNLNGLFTVISHTATTIVINIGGDPGAVSVYGNVTPDTIAVAPSMIGVHIKDHTHWKVRECSFYGASEGVRIESTVDASWGVVEDISSSWCNTGIRFMGAAAHSGIVRGGAFHVGTNQIGISFESQFSLTVEGGKYDIGENIMSGANAIGIKVAAGIGIKINNPYFETKGQSTTHCIDLGSGGVVEGTIVGARFQGNWTPNSAALETGIYCNGTDNGANAVGVDIVGCGGYGMATAIDIGPNTRGCNVIGGGLQHGNLYGVLIEAGATNTVVMNFQQRKGTTAAQYAAGYVHISDSGTLTQIQNNNLFGLLGSSTFGGSLTLLSGPVIGTMSTDTFSGAVTITVDSTKGNVHKIACTSNTASTLTPSAAGVAGQHMWIIITADGTGGNVITFASTFKSSGTLTTTASKGHTVHFISDGTNWWEVARTLAL